VISPTDIHAAYSRILPYVRCTPVTALEQGAFGSEGSLFFKLELMQHSGSFKPRGAFNRLLSASVPEAGVIAASGGNHGAAVAYAARALSCRAEIFVPAISSTVKVERIRSYGAQLIVGGADYGEALADSRVRAAETGALVVHAYDQPEVVAGQGTVGLEFEEQAPDLDTVLVAVGGGGLIGGVAAWYGSRTRVIGVEPELAPTLHRSMEAGAPVDVAVSGIAADSLGGRRAGDIAFDIARRHVERVLLVDDHSIRAAQLALWDSLRLIVEPGGATALAAILSGAYLPGRGERVGVVVCGANTDLNVFGY
jgi:threonine dehydratase